MILGTNIDLQIMFVNSSPKLHAILTFGLGLVPGLLALLAISTIMGLLAGGIFLAPQRVSSAVIQGVTWVLLIGLLRDLIITVSSRWGPLAGLFKSLFAVSGLKPLGAVFVFVLITGILLLAKRKADILR
ncbi:MAG: hypothetical protein M0C28_29475 [Candidatus Moduliflexus flocculans]|nr:hypothetical protein [Candidatus Moduliflexus flocculans]